MNNLENAIRTITELSEEVTIEIGNKSVKELYVQLAQAIMACSMAAEPDWKYPEKDKLPGSCKSVLIVLENDISKTNEGYYSSYKNKFVINNVWYELSEVVVWCELPAFNPKNFKL